MRITDQTAPFWLSDFFRSNKDIAQDTYFIAVDSNSYPDKWVLEFVDKSGNHFAAREIFTGDSGENTEVFTQICKFNSGWEIPDRGDTNIISENSVSTHTHDYINVGFNHIKMVCKTCNKVQT